MLGNHDGTLTKVDVASLNASLGLNPIGSTSIHLADQPYRTVTGAGGARTAFSHGHIWCMFNAPYLASPWNRLPVGHFITRAIGYQHRGLSGGRTVADLPNSGNPRRDDILRAIRFPLSPGVMNAVLDLIRRVTGIPENEPITLPDGSASSIAQARRVFSGLEASWIKKEGAWNAARAAVADWHGEDLAWFAQRLAMQTSSDLVVMGHTHAPVGGLTASPISYFNSGYECVAKPDMATSRFTFTRVDLDAATAELFAVEPGRGGYTVRPFSAKPIDVIQRGADYSCYARVENRGGTPLKLAGTPKASASDWVVPPPATIDPRARADVWLQDRSIAVGSAAGSAGAFAYSDGARTLNFSFRCPTALPNSTSTTLPDFETKTDARAWRKNGVDRSGHPLLMRFPVEAVRHAALAPPALKPPATAPPAIGGYSADVYAAVAKAILDSARTERQRGVVLSVAHIKAGDGKVLIDPTTETGPRGRPQLKNPPQHLSTRDVFEINTRQGRFRYVWIQGNEKSKYQGAGMLFLPPAPSAEFHIVTLNTGPLQLGRVCSNQHHAEVQLITWVDRQPAAWRSRLTYIRIDNRSRRPSLGGYSPCCLCCTDLVNFLDGLRRLAPRTIQALITWQTLYQDSLGCGTTPHCLQRLLDNGWDLQGDTGTRTLRPRAATAPPRPPLITA
jgi:hypothetical protein